MSRTHTKMRFGKYELPAVPKFPTKDRPWRREGDRLMKWLDDIAPPTPYKKALDFVYALRAAGSDTVYVSWQMWTTLFEGGGAICLRHMWVDVPGTNGQHQRSVPWLDVPCPAGRMAVFREEDP